MRLPEYIVDRMKYYPHFYQIVWRACASIPRGETETYGWIAKKAGRPGSARAVGRALAQNPFAPHVPCHRVIRSDGSLGGYSGTGGMKRKKALLKKEQKKGNHPHTGIARDTL